MEFNKEDPHGKMDQEKVKVIKEHLNSLKNDKLIYLTSISSNS